MLDKMDEQIVDRMEHAIFALFRQPFFALVLMLMFEAACDYDQIDRVTFDRANFLPRPSFDIINAKKNGIERMSDTQLADQPIFRSSSELMDKQHNNTTKNNDINNKNNMNNINDVNIYQHNKENNNGPNQYTNNNWSKSSDNQPNNHVIAHSPWQPMITLMPNLEESIFNWDWTDLERLIGTSFPPFTVISFRRKLTQIYLDLIRPIIYRYPTVFGDWSDIKTRTKYSMERFLWAVGSVWSRGYWLDDFDRFPALVPLADMFNHFTPSPSSSSSSVYHGLLLSFNFYDSLYCMKFRIIWKGPCCPFYLIVYPIFDLDSYDLKENSKL